MDRGQIPLARILFAFIIGIFIGFNFEPDLLWYHRVIFSLYTILFIFSILHLFIKKITVSFYSGSLFLLGMVFLGWILQWKTHPNVETTHFSHFETDALTGIVSEEPVHTDGYLRFRFTVKSGVAKFDQFPVKGMLLVYLRRDSNLHDIEYGDELIIKNNYSEPFTSYIPGSFDYRNYLAMNDIWHISFLDKKDYWRRDKKKGHVLIYSALSYRKQMLAQLKDKLSNKSALTIASALILGYRQNMDAELMNTFAETGTIHVLAVSGLHVGIIYICVSTLLFWMNRSPSLRIMRVILIILSVSLYALITGLSPSVLRASLMIGFAIIAINSGRENIIYNTISGSALILLLYDPKLIVNIGFQLSYLAVIAIVYLYPLREVIVLKNKVLQLLWDYSAVSIAAQLITFPLVIYYFNIFPLYFLPANLFIILPAVLIVYLGFGLLLIPYDTLASFIAVILERLILFVQDVLSFFAQLPFASFHITSLSVLTIMLIYVFIFSLVFAFTLRKKKLLYICMVSLFILTSSRLWNYYSSQQIEIHINNVNRNLAISILKPHENLIYIDSTFVKTKSYLYFLESLENRMGRGSIREIVYPNSYRSKDILIEKNIVQIKEKRIFILEQLYNTTQPIITDILLIRANLKQDLSKIQEYITFNTLILDGSNTDQNIEFYVRAADSLSVPVYVLKNNFSYVW